MVGTAFVFAAALAGEPLSKEAVDAVIKAHLAGVKYCYEVQLQQRPGLEGMLEVAWTIEKDGHVSDAHVHAQTIASPEVEGCILRQVRRWQFPAATERTVIGRYPFVFKGAAATAPADADAAARRQATAMYDAYTRGDLDTFVSYMLPKAIALVGGKKKVVAAMQELAADLRAQGLTLASATVSAPKQVIAGASGSVQAIIPTELVFRSGQRAFHQPSFLLGLSSDGGKTWKFTDTGSAGADTLRKAFPECSPRLEIPSRPDGYETKQ